MKEQQTGGGKAKAQPLNKRSDPGVAGAHPRHAEEQAQERVLKAGDLPIQPRGSGVGAELVPGEDAGGGGVRCG